MLELKNICAGYSNHPVLQQLNLTINPGFTVILGPNGSGKTTLFRTIMGTMEPTQGQVLFQHEDLHKLSVKSRAQKIAQVLGVHQTLSGINGLDLVEMALYPRRNLFYHLSLQEIREIQQLAEQFQVAPLLTKNLEALSAGERQLIELLAAVYQNTPVLLLDEPTANLDFNHTHEFMNLVQDLSKEKIVIASLHDPALALNYGDRIVLLKAGKIAEAFEPKKLSEKEIENRLHLLYPQIAVHFVDNQFVISYEKNNK